MIFRLFIILVAILSLQPTAKADVVVETALDSTTIRIGEQVRMRAKVTVPKGTHVLFPEYKNGDLTEGVEVLNRTTPDTSLTDEGQRWVLTREYLLTSFDSALYHLPCIEVKVGGKVYRSNEELGLKVSSIEVDTIHLDKIRDPYGPVMIPFEWNIWFLMRTMGVWILLLSFTVFLCRLMTFKPLRRRISIMPPPPAHQVALRAIESIKQKSTETDEELKHYYDELTDILRTYIKERFDIDALEMTTPQLVSALNAAEDKTAINDLRELFETADLVKFARLRTSDFDNDRSIVHALEYVNLTKSAVPQPERIEKIVDVNKRKRQILIVFDWTLTILLGLATVAYSGWIIYQMVLLFR